MSRLLLLVLAVLLCPPAEAAWRLLDAEGVHGPRAPLRLQIDAAAPDGWRLLLDGIDVTALAAVRDGLVEIIPLQALAPGDHRLEAWAEAPDGSLRPLGAWTVHVEAPWTDRLAVDGQAELTAQRRLHGAGLAPEPDPYGAQGAAGFDVGLQGEDWRFASRIDLVYNHAVEQTLGGRRLDLGGFHAELSGADWRLAAGDQDPIGQGLLGDGALRRGLAAHWRPDENSELSGYALRTEPVFGFVHGLGVSDADHRLSGLAARRRLLDGAALRLDAGLHYLFGKGSAGGVGLYDPEAARLDQGDAWALSLDGGAWREQLQWRLEAARSRYDFDGAGFGEDPRAGRAASLFLRWQPAPPDGPAAWRVDLEAAETGADYRSIANPFLPGDRVLRRLTVFWQDGPWSAQWGGAAEWNNLDREPDRAITEQRQWQAELAYTGFASWPLWGQPSLRLGWTAARQFDRAAPPGWLAPDVRSHEWHLVAEGRYERAGWGLNYRRGALRDAADLQIDSRSQGLDVNLQLAVGDRLRLGPLAQWQQVLNRDFGTLSEQTLFGLALDFDAFERRLSGRVSLGLNRFDAADDPYYASDTRRFDGSLELRWRLRDAEANRPGWELTLSGATQRARDRLLPAADQDARQVYLGLRWLLPVARPGGTP